MFKYNLGDPVFIILGKLEGKVTGRAEYIHHPNQYQVHHLDGTKTPVYAWYEEQDLVQ